MTTINGNGINPLGETWVPTPLQATARMTHLSGWWLVPSAFLDSAGG